MDGCSSTTQKPVPPMTICPVPDRSFGRGQGVREDVKSVHAGAETVNRVLERHRKPQVYRRKVQT